MRTTAFRLSCLALVLILALNVSSAPVPKAGPQPKELPTAEFIRKTLDAKIDMEFAGTNLPAVLAQLSEDHHVNFVLDRIVLQQMGMEPNELTVNIKLKGVKLRNGLRAIAGQYNLTLAIVGDSVILTTEEQAIYKQLKHRIDVDLDNVPLHKALRDLARANGINVVIDPRTMKSKAAEAAVTLTIDDVPFEAAVRIMCEMAGLKPARMGNVIYVTTDDRADKLKDSDSLVPNPGFPGGAINPIQGNAQLLPAGVGGGAVPAPPMAAPAPPVEEKKE